MEQGETDGLLYLGITVDLDVRAGPEIVKIGPLLGEQPLPASLAGGGQRGRGLVAQRWQGALLRPSIGNELDEPQLLTRSKQRGDGHATGVSVALGGHPRGRPPVNRMIHSSGDPDSAVPRPVHQLGVRTMAAVPLRHQRRLQRHGGPRVHGLCRQLLVGDQLGLHNQPGRGIQRLDLVADRRHGPLDKGDQPHRRHADRLARR